MGRLRRSRTHHGIRDISRKYRTRNYAKDLDQIFVDMKAENASKLENQPIDADLPGLAQHYCLPCAKYFTSANHLSEHYRGKIHKKRVKLLKEKPYSHKEAETAAGMGSFDNGKLDTMKD